MLYVSLCILIARGGAGSYSHVDESSHTVYFGPQFNQESWLFEASVTTLKCSIVFYIRFVKSIDDNIDLLTQICENSLPPTEEL